MATSRKRAIEDNGLFLSCLLNTIRVRLEVHHQ